MKSKKAKKMGLALGGGAVLGAAQVGVLRVIDEYEIRITHVTGTSIGAFVAAFFAYGKSWKEIQEIAGELKWLDITGISLSRFALLSNKKLGELIVKHIGDKKIEDADIPLAMVAADIATGEKIVLKKGPVAQAVMASTCIPGVFNPVEIDGKMLVDGGVVENVPVNTLKDLGAKRTIAVDLNSQHSYGSPENILDVIMNSYHYTMQASAELQTKDADILLKPDLSAFNRSNMDQVDNLMEKGYKDAKKQLKKYLKRK
jgi:NTE family protein